MGQYKRDLKKAVEIMQDYDKSMQRLIQSRTQLLSSQVQLSEQQAIFLVAEMRTHLCHLVMLVIEARKLTGLPIFLPLFDFDGARDTALLATFTPNI